MRNLLRPLVLGLIGACLLGAIGFLITNLAVPDWKSQFEGSDRALASASVRGAQRCLEHPLEQMLIQRFHIDELTVEQITSTHVGTAQDAGNGTAGDGASLSRGDGVQTESTHRAKVSAYTLFAIPIFTISVSGSAPDLPGNCQRVRGAAR